jgi:hypothetical protein
LFFVRLECEIRGEECYDRGWLRGQSNPVGGSDPNVTKVANLLIACL